MGCRAG